MSCNLMQEKIYFREITIDDLPKLAKMYVETFNSAPWNDEWIIDTAGKRLKQMINTEDSYGLCIYQNDVLCGAMLGLSFCQILRMEHVIIMSVIAIVLNLISRAASVGAASAVAGRLPDGYDKKSFVKLLTWGGLRGGLSVALAMSTVEMVSTDVYYLILGCTYAVVFFTTIVQGMTMPKVYENIKMKLFGK